MACFNLVFLCCVLTSYLCTLVILSGQPCMRHSTPANANIDPQSSIATKDNVKLQTKRFNSLEIMEAEKFMWTWNLSRAFTKLRSITRTFWTNRRVR
jgi:hypothetical protein